MDQDTDDYESPIAGMDAATYSAIMEEEFRDDEKEVQNTKIIQKLQAKLVTAESSNLCAICLKSYRKGETIFQLSCSHHFHTDCIEPWLMKNAHCPTCRFNLAQNVPQGQEDSDEYEDLR